MQTKKIKDLARQNPADYGKIRNPRATNSTQSQIPRSLTENDQWTHIAELTFALGRPEKVNTWKQPGTPSRPSEISSVKRRKTVTQKKIEANRRNARRSTGPRTERGKRTSRFNALTLGLFAKHVVIPICDGYKSEGDFQSLLNGLHGEFQPIGLYEEWLVLKIAECMWRLRRATRCESGSVREATIWDQHRDKNQIIARLASELCLLGEAEEQLRDSGTLTRKTYEQVMPLVEEEKRKKIQSDKGNESVETEIDNEFFLTCVTDRKKSLDSMYNAVTRIEGDRSDARFDYKSLLPEEDMDRIFCYEERMHKMIDWAVRKLLESQQRRGPSHSSIYGTDTTHPS